MNDLDDTYGRLATPRRQDLADDYRAAPRQGGISAAGSALELDQSSAEAPTSLAETLARLLAVWTFTAVALTGPTVHVTA